MGDISGPGPRMDVHGTPDMSGPPRGGMGMPPRMNMDQGRPQFPPEEPRGDPRRDPRSRDPRDPRGGMGRGPPMGGSANGAPPMLPPPSNVFLHLVLEAT